MSVRNNNMPLPDSLLEAIKAIQDEEIRSSRFLHLTAHENRLSKFARAFLSSNLAFRQHEGTLDEHGISEVITHGQFMLMGLPGIYRFEALAREAAQEMFHASLSDFRPLSGLHGMLCTFATTTTTGDTVFTINPEVGGHSAAQPMLASMGRNCQYIPWSGLNVDLEAFEVAVRRLRPRLIYLDHGTPIFRFPLVEMREIIGDQTVFAYDGSHTLGLIAGGYFQNPLSEGCNILQGNMHKTFPGPQKGLLNFRDHEFGLQTSARISAALVSSQHTHHSIAAYATTLEMKAFGRAYAEQMVANARLLGQCLQRRGILLVSNRDGEFTASHQLLIATDDADNYCRRLFECGISTNARTAFGRRVVRIAVQEVTRRGMRGPEMEVIADLIARALVSPVDSGAIRREVTDFHMPYTKIAFSFDDQLGLD